MTRIFEKAVKSGVSNCYFNSGQTCSALTRMLVPRERHDEAVKIAASAAAKFGPGDPRDSNTKLGPLVSATQRDRVIAYIKKGIEEGATLVTGGAEAPQGLEKGYFVQPTVFANVRPDMTIAQEEDPSGQCCPSSHTRMRMMQFESQMIPSMGWRVASGHQMWNAPSEWHGVSVRDRWISMVGASTCPLRLVVTNSQAMGGSLASMGSKNILK